MIIVMYLNILDISLGLSCQSQNPKPHKKLWTKAG